MRYYDCSPGLLANNEQFHRMLTEGISVSVHRDGAEKGELVWLIDFDNPLNNDFTVVGQYTILENGRNKRPDLILFVNGLLLVVIELKNTADENAMLRRAFRQVETYKDAIPSLRLHMWNGTISEGLIPVVTETEKRLQNEAEDTKMSSIGKIPVYK